MAAGAHIPLVPDLHAFPPLYISTPKPLEAPLASSRAPDFALPTSYAVTLRLASPRASKKSFKDVWVHFPDLPIHMFEKSSLFSAASIIGKPIKIDEVTADGSRLFMASVCIEIDLLKLKVEDFWIGIRDEKRLQRVVYEKHPVYCVQCSHLGHSEEDCYAFGNKPKPIWMGDGKG
ncbi:hypothetical protein ZIOFF_065559 [Zingiber officinale]|uniref:DUF4283 domain-containing protein n=1 Tax=Zingiber officinale TaxID=94328 RepID=A0A8J5EXI9_ZINOF|nr:hypothetical protein ZIOFF_065559 [Zingiber officinale]